MSEFNQFKKSMQDNFAQLILAGQHRLYTVDVDKEQMWDIYLNSFPEDIRQEYNCNCCKSFIRQWGNLVAIVGAETVSIWDFSCKAPFDKVVFVLNNLVRNQTITNRFFVTHPGLGTDFNRALAKPGISGGGSTVTWHHMFFQLPKEMVYKGSDSVETLMGEARDKFHVLQRGLEEITVDALETTLDLIAQNSLYRGAEFKSIVEQFLVVKRDYERSSTKNRANYCWTASGVMPGAISRIRNSAIGTLLLDLSNDKDLDEAVRAFERVMAPANYKRPTALVTKKMIEQAEKTIQELGYGKSLGRRFATVDDLTVNNLLFVNREKKKSGGVFEDLKENALVNPKSLSKLEEVSLPVFLANILPKCTGIEVLFENKHVPNLVSLIAAENQTASSLFKWSNPFSWSYRGSMADSLKEKVKAAGGRVEGELRVSLEWYNYDDLDLHVIEPDGFEIYYRSRHSLTGGNLDVDMNANGPKTREAVENTIWPTQHKMQEGLYKVFVNQFCNRETIDAGFSLEVECQGQLLEFSYDQSVRGKHLVCELDYTKKDGIKLVRAGKVNQSSKISTQKIWGIETNKFHKVSMIMNSPNYWNGNGVGNSHLLFIVDEAHNDEQARGFFNEFLKEELVEHKRVFEALGSRMKVAPADKQVSGLGFSSTQQNEVICKVEGTFSRTLKIKF